MRWASRPARAALALACLSGCGEPPSDEEARVALEIRLLSSGSGYSQEELGAAGKAKVGECASEGSGVWRCGLDGGKRARFERTDRGWVALPD